jgi:hypothetical protein
LTLDPPDLSTATSALNQLRTLLRDQLSTGSLPAYDQRSYDTQLKELETKLAARRARDTTAKPKTKFAFSKAKAVANAKDGPASIGPANDSPSTSGSSQLTLTDSRYIAGGDHDPALSARQSQSSSKAGSSVVTPPAPAPASASTRASTSTSNSASSNSYKISSLSNRHITLTDLATFTDRPVVDGPSGSPSQAPEIDYVLNLSNLTDCVIDLRQQLASRAGGSEQVFDGPSSSRHAQDELSRDADKRVLTALHAKNLDRCVVILPSPRDDVPFPLDGNDPPSTPAGLRGSLFLFGIRNSLLCLSGQQVSYSIKRAWLLGLAHEQQLLLLRILASRDSRSHVSLRCCSSYRK